MHFYFSATEFECCIFFSYLVKEYKCCRFSYAGTWELVNLFVRTKNFSYHICYENIGRTMKLRDRPWTDRTYQYVSKEERIQ